MSAVIAGVRTNRSSTSHPSGFIIGPVADIMLIIGAPVWGLILALILFSFPDNLFDVYVHSQRFDLRRVFMAAFVNAHTFVMFFRSHGNERIFRSHPFRFTVIPIAMIALGTFNTTALMAMGLVIVWWDIYHAAMQTFGFGRIYDSKQKNDAMAGRTLDWWFNLLMVAGPVLSGTNFITHLNNTRDVLQFMTTDGSTANEWFLHRIPDYLERNQRTVATGLLAVGIPFVAYYLYAYYRLSRRGYRVSWQKVWLLAISSIVSIWIWGFNSFEEGFWVQNFFHCLQYFAIVAFSEQKNLPRIFRVDQLLRGAWLALVWFTLFSFLFGIWAAYFASGSWSMSLLVTTAIMHYWYDGFIWSVKQKQV